MFIKIGNVYINAENVAYFIVSGDEVTVFFVGGGSVTFDAEDAKHFLAEVGRGGKY